MHVSPELPPAKRSRAKPKQDVVAAPAPARKQSKSKTSGAVTVAAAQLDSPDLTPAVAVTAYFIAAERNFAPGHELDDWLEAERRVCR